MCGGTVTPDFGDALAEFRELTAYGRVVPYLGEALSEFLDSGAPPFTAHVDPAVAVPTSNLDVRYQLADGLHVLLAAGRAWNRHADDVPVCFGHDAGSDVEISPEMIRAGVTALRRLVPPDGEPLTDEAEIVREIALALFATGLSQECSGVKR